MGVDISMSIRDKNGICTHKDIFADRGRDYEWFDNLQGDGDDPLYDKLPIVSGFPNDVISEEDKELYEGAPWNGCYGFYNINVGDYKKWYDYYRPYQKAGWVRKYDEFLYRFKHIVPNSDNVSRYLSDEEITEDFVFLIYNDRSGSETWLYEFLIENAIDDESYIMYYFDH